MGHSRSIPVVSKEESIVSCKHTKNQEDNNTNNTTTNNIHTNNTTTNKNIDTNNNTNNTALLQTSKSFTNSASKITSTLTASTSISNSANKVYNNNNNNNNNNSCSSCSSSSKSVIFQRNSIIHDPNYCMFKLQVDTEGNTAALCYLPTRYKNIVEFYHIEIPSAYRNLGLGDLLLRKAFEWAENSRIRVVPTCPFVTKYLVSHFPDRKSGGWSCIISSDK